MKNFKVILTRSKKDGKEWLKKLKENKIEGFCIPVQYYKFNKKIDFELDKKAVFVFTSVKGIKGILKILKRKKYDCFVLGEREERDAKKNGFNVLFKAEEPNSNSLAIKIIENLPEDRSLIYPASELYNKEFEKKLKENGFDLKVLILYKPVRKKLMEKDLKIIKKGSDIVFFSPSQVQNFLSQVSLNKLKFKRLWAIGKKTHSTLSKYGNCFLLREPRVEEFLKEIKNLRRGDGRFQ